MTDSSKNQKASRVKRDAFPSESAFNALINETVLLFHRLRIVADQVHHHGEMTGGLRGILRGLDKLGQQTVPQMARVRAVSRQNIQVLINQLVEDGLVEFVGNPAHKRSPLARLTARGKKAVDAMNREEAKLLSKASLGVAENELRDAAETLRIVRSYFESDRWKRLVNQVK